MRVHLSDGEFGALRRLLRDAAGLVFDEARREPLAHSVQERLRATGTPDVSTYLALLTDATERQHLLDAVTIQETHFFRNPPQTRALREHVLPELVRRAAAGSKRLRIWSAGCSTGEEVYTVAILLRELLPDLTGWDVQVVGTDISTRALAAARTARYGVRALAMTEPDDVRRWFTLSEVGYEVRPELRELVEFRAHNLVTEAPPFPPGELVDLVLCRNVTIYFARDTTRALVQRLHGCLSDGGYLFLGHSETLWQVSDDFRLVTLGDAFVYRREAGPDERRRVLPDRRTGDDGPPPVGLGVERRGRPRRAEGQPVQAVPAAAARTEPGVDLPALLEQTRAALAGGNYAGAADLAARAGAADPMRAEAWYLRGLALVNAGRDPEALVELRKALYADPGAGFAHFLLGGALARLGDRSGAARSYRAAAMTLGGRPGDERAPELGGRSVGELVALCRQLAHVLDPSPAD